MNITLILTTLIICITVLILVSILSKSDNEPTVINKTSLKAYKIPSALLRYDYVYIEELSNKTFRLTYYDYDDDNDGPCMGGA